MRECVRKCAPNVALNKSLASLVRPVFCAASQNTCGLA